MGNVYDRLRLASTDGTLKRVHVDQKIIRGNVGADVKSPPVTVQTSSGSLKAMVVTIEGPSQVIYRPDDPLSCGARLWVETHAPVVLE